MQKRVRFNDPIIRNQFFSEVLKSRTFSSWKALQAYSQISKSALEKYRNGSLLIPSNKYEDLSRLLNTGLQNHFLKQIILLDGNWGAKKGGDVTHSKHPEIFEQGRVQSWEKRISNSKNLFTLELLKDKRFCEFIGAFTGDGFTNEYNKHYLTQFTGDSRFDLEYYERTIKPLLKAKLKLNSTITKKKNTLRFNIYSKLLYQFLTQDLKFPAGKKCYTVKIPIALLEDTSQSLATVRGIYDTDGCFFVDKRKIYSKPYPRTTLQLANPTLIHQVFEILVKAHLKPTITKNGCMIQVNGERNVRDFLRVIGFTNSRHINRIKRWRPDLITELSKVVP